MYACVYVLVQVLATGKGNAIAGDMVYTPLGFDALLKHKHDAARGAELNPQDPALIHSPWLSLQVSTNLARSAAAHVDSVHSLAQCSDGGVCGCSLVCRRVR